MHAASSPVSPLTCFEQDLLVSLGLLCHSLHSLFFRLGLSCMPTGYLLSWSLYSVEHSRAPWWGKVSWSFYPMWQRKLPTGCCILHPNRRWLSIKVSSYSYTPATHSLLGVAFSIAGVCSRMNGDLRRIELVLNESVDGPNSSLSCAFAISNSNVANSHYWGTVVVEYRRPRARRYWIPKTLHRNFIPFLLLHFWVSFP